MERYDNEIYMARRKVFMDHGMTHDEAHELIRMIRNAEILEYTLDKDLRDRMEPLEAQGRILDIYNNMYTDRRIGPLVANGMDEKQALDLSAKLHLVEKALIERYDSINGSFKDQRDALIQKAGECLQELKTCTSDGQNIEDKINALMNTGISKETASKHYIEGDVLAIRTGRDSPHLESMLYFTRSRDDLIISGMPSIIADTKIAEAGIQLEQSKAIESEFTDGVESIQESDPGQAI